MGDTPAAKSEEPMQKKQKRYKKTPALHAKRVASNNLLTANGDESFRQAVAPAVAPRTSHAEGSNVTSMTTTLSKAANYVKAWIWG